MLLGLAIAALSGKLVGAARVIAASPADVEHLETFGHVEHVELVDTCLYVFIPS